MTTLEITLIIIGVFFLIGSFMVKDKLSKKDLDKIADMSAEELKIITEKELKTAESAIDDILDEQITSKTDETKRSLEKETNDKIMAISEYSDTVLESINKAHNEIMFLYSMLNDKHDELTQLSSDIDKIQTQARKTFEPLDSKVVSSATKPAVTPVQRMQAPETPQIPVTQVKAQGQPQPLAKAQIKQVSQPVTLQNSVTSHSPQTSQDVKVSQSAEDINHNNNILALHKAGHSAVEIAKELGLGTGEVKLVIDLYKEGK